MDEILLKLHMHSIDLLSSFLQVLSLVINARKVILFNIPLFIIVTSSIADYFLAHEGKSSSCSSACPPAG